MISIKKKFLFIHVPKTGGNSVQSVIRHYSEDDIVILNDRQDGIERFGVRNKRYNISKHSTLAHYKSVLSSDVFRSLYKFSTIRNPWDMMISFYFSPHRGVRDWDRNDFLNLLEGVQNLRYYICEDAIFFQGASFSKRKIDSDIDYLMRFEQLENDFKNLCKKIRIPDSSLPRRNVSPRSHYRKYYDNELRILVQEKFKEEIDFGEYEF